MNTFTLQITKPDDNNIMLAGWIFAAADLRKPIIDHSVVLKTTLESKTDLPPGVYFYRFNASVSGKFTVAATNPAVPAQSQTFDTSTDGQFHLSFRFQVSM